MAEPGEVDGAGGVEGLLWCAGGETGAQNATAINGSGQIVANTTSNHTLLLTPN